MKQCLLTFTLCCFTLFANAQKTVTYDTIDNINVMFALDEYDMPYHISVNGPAVTASGTIVQTMHDRGKDDNRNNYDDYTFRVHEEDDLKYLPDGMIGTSYDDKDNDVYVTLRYITATDALKKVLLTVRQDDNIWTSEVKITNKTK